MIRIREIMDPDLRRQILEKLAEQHGRTPSDLWVELERTGQMQALESEIMEEKVFAHLSSRNTVTQG